MASPNFNMRDPTLYGSACGAPPTGDDWCIYPMDDFAHPLSDASRGSRTRSAP
jgi:glutaminyl-tRNA synthetase